MICQLKSLLSNNYVEEEKLGNWSFKEEKKGKISKFDIISFGERFQLM